MATKTWQFDPVHSSINFSVRHMVVSKVRGQFARWSGTLELDDALPGNSRASVTIDAASIDTRDEKRDAHLRSPDFFETDKFPSITFVSRSAQRTGEDKLKLTGDLTIHGVTREIVLDVEHSGKVNDPWGNERIGFTAKASIDRKDFGLGFNIPLDGGGVVVGNHIEIGIEIEAQRALATVTTAPVAAAPSARA